MSRKWTTVTAENCLSTGDNEISSSKKVCFIKKGLKGLKQCSAMDFLAKMKYLIII